MSTQHDQPPIISKQDAENELASLSARIEDNTQEAESLFQELEKSGSSKDEIDALRNQINFENTKKIQDAYRATEEAYEKKEQEETGQRVLKKLEQVKLSDEDFQNIPEWKSLSDEQKMLVAELATQDALARVQQLGKERFEENTKKAPILSKIKRKIFKSVWITKEEKGALADVQSGKLKPAEKTLQEIIKRTKDLDLSPVGENGKLIIGFMETNNNIPTNERQTLDEYNTLANEFARMPYTWSNEKAANSKDGAIFKKENYTKYKSIEKQYEETKKAIIEINKKAYEAQGIKAIDAAKKAMEDMRQSDMKVQLLQYMTTNPDALGELERINTEASWGRLWNNETVARSGYMLGGWAGRSVAVTALGTMTAPIVASVIGGLRALRRANQKIGTAFEEGLKHETILERKASGKTGTFDDKNANLSIGQKAGKILSGFDVNAKQIGTFVDADMLIHRLDGYEKKLKEAESEEEKQKIITLIQHRIAYIDQKMRAGLINYGSVNPTGENYDLIMRLSKMAVTYMQPDLTIAPEGESDQERIAREKLLAEKTAHDKKLEQILNYNTKRFENRQTTFQTKEIVRGMLLGSTFAVAGMGIRHGYEWVRDIVKGDNTLDATLSEAGNTGSASVNNTEESTVENVAPIDTVENSSIKPIIQDSTISNATSSDVGNISTTETATAPVTPESLLHKPIEVQLSSKGSIQTFLDLKEKLRLEYGKDLAHAPASVQHIMNTNATKLAEEFNMYNPTDVDESMMAPAGSKFIIDEKGNF